MPKFTCLPLSCPWVPPPQFGRSFVDQVGRLGPMSSLYLLSLSLQCHPPGFYSAAIRGPSEGDSWLGCRRHAECMTNPPPSLCLLYDGFSPCYAALLVVRDGVWPKYADNSS